MSSGSSSPISADQHGERASERQRVGVKNIGQIEGEVPSAREMLVAPFSLSALSLPSSVPLPCSVLDDVTAKNAVSKGKGRRGREDGDDDDDDEDSAREGGEEMAVFPALYSASFPVTSVEGGPPRSRSGLITRFVGVVKCQR